MTTLSEVMLADPTKGMDVKTIKGLQSKLGVKNDGIWGPISQEAYTLDRKKNQDALNKVQKDAAADKGGFTDSIKDWGSEHGGEIIAGVGTSVLSGLLAPDRTTTRVIQGRAGQGGADTLASMLRGATGGGSSRGGRRG